MDLRIANLTRTVPVRRKLHPSGSALRLLSLAVRRAESRCGGARLAKPMPIYDQTASYSFLRMLNPKNGLTPGNPDRVAARIIETVDVEPAPLRLVLGSRALDGTLTTRETALPASKHRPNSPLRRTYRRRHEILWHFLTHHDHLSKQMIQ
jgi:hypothetical protein